ncbi:hypothetical protein DDE82_000175 [Stemphylium lycopersici]|uniref:Fungal N-terminal domain-containing protein n=1 Tax=Stemphylium lycopersici TaxID=183478 RepID=A0A364N6J4_STELY|nr:hypothetical protein DDE82_000175 [Stemphylium lycopersici]RAR12651.1 hypothetical protein DDE83_004048 [Stemphylium lycopersici]
MAETLGLVASVVQLAGAGLKLSQALYQYADGVATADRRIKDIAKEIKLTSFVIEELGRIFKQDDTSGLISKSAVETANETLKECSAVFEEIETTLNKSKKGKMGRLMLPFRESKIELLRNHIDKLKSTLQLLMQVLAHAYQVATNKLDREAEAKQREEIRQLNENRKKSTEKYEELLRSISNSDNNTLVDEDEHQQDDGSGSNMTTWSIGSTLNPDSLAKCMNHIKALMGNIEQLQQAMTKKDGSDDHSEHHQRALGSYFITRTYLDNVLLGGSTGVATFGNKSKGTAEAIELEKYSRLGENSSSDRFNLSGQPLKRTPGPLQMRAPPDLFREASKIRKKTNDTATRLQCTPETHYRRVPLSSQTYASEQRDDVKAAVAACSTSAIPQLGIFQPRRVEQADEPTVAYKECKEIDIVDVEVRLPDYDTVPDRRMLGMEGPPSSSAHGPESSSTSGQKADSLPSNLPERDVVDELLREWTTMLG